MTQGVYVDCEAKFYVETFEAGKGPVAIGVYNPNNVQVLVSIA